MKGRIMSDTEITPILKPSSEWAAEQMVFILDPDGWDRKNLEASWLEPISEAEFNSRMIISTVISISNTTPTPDAPADTIYTDSDGSADA